MNTKYFLMILLFMLIACNKNFQPILEKANKAYDSDNKDTAKSLYLKAAKMGSAEAHFSIAYKYVLTEEESIYHFSEAAKLGHGEALGYALEALLFRANSLTKINPKKALEIYEIAKKKNPSIDLYDEENKIKVIKKCIEAEPFNAEEFIKKYNLKEDEDFNSGGYHIWELAEEASKGGRFGNPDPKLVFQLIIRGGSVPAELEYAVNDFYDNWKKGVVKEFNICDYVTSGIGMAYCSGRAEIVETQKQDKEFENISSKLKFDSKDLFKKAYGAAVKFIESKAWNEEGHDGSGYITWATNSIIEQKSKYLKLVESINSGFIPDQKNTFEESDKLLNATYQSIIKKLKEKPISGMKFTITPKEVRTVQRLWIPYRDASVTLFNKINPTVDVNLWKSWFTDIRIKELNSILELEY